MHKKDFFLLIMEMHVTLATSSHHHFILLNIHFSARRMTLTQAYLPKTDPGIIGKHYECTKMYSTNLRTHTDNTDE